MSEIPSKIREDLQCTARSQQGACLPLDKLQAIISQIDREVVEGEPLGIVLIRDQTTGQWLFHATKNFEEVEEMMKSSTFLSSIIR